MKKRLRPQKRNWNGKTSVVLAIFNTFFISVCFCSCAPYHKFDSIVSESEATRILTHFENREKAFSRFRGLGKLQIKGAGPSKTMRIAWIGARPGNLRLEMLGMWGQPLATFLLKEPDFFLYIVKDNLCYKGKSTARNLSRMLTVSIESEDLFNVMSGHPPIPTFRKAKVQTTTNKRQTLSLFGPWSRIVQKMWFSDTRKVIERVESFDSLGDVKYTILFSNFKNNGDYLVPYAIQIVRPSGTEMLINIDKFQNGISIPDKAFVLDLGDAKVIGLDS